MKDRMLLDLRESDGDDGVQFVAHDDELYIQAYCEWCGDTESGFGAEVGVTIGRDDARKLSDFLAQWLAPQPIAVATNGTNLPQDKKEGR